MREQNKRRSRARIIKAARRLFNAKGYEETMLAEVAAKARVAKTTLYNYFPNKESLLFGIFEEAFTDTRRAVLADLKDETDADKKVRYTLTYSVVDVVPYISLARRIIFSNARDAERHALSLLDVRSLFLEMVRYAQSAHVYQEAMDPHFIVDLLMGVYYFALYCWPNIENHSPEEIEARLSIMLDYVLKGIYA